MPHANPTSFPFPPPKTKNFQIIAGQGEEPAAAPCLAEGAILAQDPGAPSAERLVVGHTPGHAPALSPALRRAVAVAATALMTDVAVTPVAHTRARPRGPAHAHAHPHVPAHAHQTQLSLRYALPQLNGILKKNKDRETLCSKLCLV